MAKAKVKVPALPAPQNLSEAADYLRRIGELEREMATITAGMNEKIEEVKLPYMDQAERARQRLEELVGGLYAYAASHRVELTDNDKRKTVTVPTGLFGWRMTPKAVTIKGVKEVLARLEQLKLSQFIRIKKEPDKEAMLKDEPTAAAIEGVTISQREEFFAKPAETSAEVSVTPGRDALKVALATGPKTKETAKRKKSA